MKYAFAFLLLAVAILTCVLLFSLYMAIWSTNADLQGRYAAQSFITFILDGAAIGFACMARDEL